MNTRKEMRQAERRHREKRAEFGKSAAKRAISRVSHLEWMCGKLQQALKGAVDLR